MVKLTCSSTHGNVRLTSLCDYHGYSLLKYDYGSYMYRCGTYLNNILYLPECIECLCQSAELLEGELSGKNSLQT